MSHWSAGLSPALHLRGPLLMLASALLFAVLDSLIKLLGPPFRVWDIAFYRFAFGLVILWGLTGWRRNPLRGNGLGLLVIRGITGCIAFLALVMAIRLIPFSTALVLFYAYPAFAALFSALLFRESLTHFELLCVGMTFCGVMVFFDFSVHFSTVGQLIAVLAAAFAGLATALIRKLRESNGPIIIYFYLCLLGAVIAFPAFISNPQVPATPYQLLLVIGIIMASLAGQLLMNQGFYYCKSCEGGLLMTSEVIFTSMFGILFLGEIASWRFWSGGGLILAGIVALNWGNARRTSFRGIASAD